MHATCFLQARLHSASVAWYLWKDESDLEMCWRKSWRTSRCVGFPEKNSGYQCENALSVGQGRRRCWWHRGRPGWLAGKIQNPQQCRLETCCRAAETTPQPLLLQITCLSFLFSPHCSILFCSKGNLFSACISCQLPHERNEARVGSVELGGFGTVKPGGNEHATARPRGGDYNAPVACGT